MEKTIQINCTGSDTKSIDEIKEFQGNLKDLSDQNFEKLKKEILELGFCEPISIWKGNICNGHQRLKVLKKMQEDGYLIPKIPVNIIKAKDKKEAKKIVLALTSQYGQITEEGLFNFMQDADILLDEVKESFNFNEIDMESFEDNFFNKTTDEQNEKEDDVPEVDPEKVKTKLGDLIELGNHRLLCGDCTVKENVDYLMDGKKADMVFTDPPYSVNYTKKNKEILKSKDYCEIKNDSLSVKETSEQIWSPCFKNIYEASNDVCSVYCTMPQGGDQMMMMMMMMMQESWQVKHELIWVKESPVFSMGRLDYDYKHEPILYGWKKKHAFYGKGSFTKSVWEIKRDGNKQHPTMKPIALIENAVLNSTKKDQLVIDPFLGSGSTLIACEKTKRKCYGMELDEYYCDVIIKRWCDYTGINEFIRNGKKELI